MNVEAAVAAIRLVMTDPHDPCDGDCWYACPKSGQCCDDRQDKSVCLCGKDARDALLRDALRALGHDE